MRAATLRVRAPNTSSFVVAIRPRHARSVLSLARITSRITFRAIAHTLGSPGMSWVFHVKQVPPVIVSLNVKIAVIAGRFRFSVAACEQLVDVGLGICVC